MRHLLVVAVALHLVGAAARAQEVTGELRQWHAVALTFAGPATSESAEPNPFLHYRLDVTFEKDGRRVVVPGYFAADGNAAETSAAAGDRWRAHFVPDETGTWSYRVCFREGPDVAVAADPSAGSPAFSEESPLLVQLQTTLDTAVTRPGDRVEAAIISPERYLAAHLRGVVETVAPGRIALRFPTLRAGSRRLSLRASLTGFVNSKGHPDMDDTDRAARVVDGALVSEGSGLRLDEGAELTLLAAPEP